MSIFKLKGIEYYIVNAKSKAEAVITALANRWGVTEANIEEVSDISENPIRIIKAHWNKDENDRLTWFRCKFDDGNRKRTYYLSSFYGIASDALSEGLGSYNKDWLKDIKVLETDGRHPGEWVEPLINPLKQSRTKKLTNLILGGE